MNVDALPIPPLDSPAAMNPWNIRGLGKLFGIALLATWIVPWLKMGGLVWPWTYMKIGAFEAVWALLAGGGLLAIGFVPSGTLKLGHMVLGGAAIGLLGLISVTTGINLPLGYTFSLFGLIGLTIATFLWARYGHSQILWIAVITALAFMLLGLLIPVGFGPASEMPLISIFTVFSGPGFIVGKIFFLLFGLAYLGLMAAAVAFVVLPQQSAELGWLRIVGVAAFIYLPATYLIAGLFLFSGFPLLALHKIVEIVAYGWLVVMGTLSVIDAQRRGTLQAWF